MTDKLRMPRLLGFYSRYVEDRDTAAFVKDVSPRYNGGTLQRLAQHSRREVRRGAVFALGLIGEYETNHTLGCALLDADRTVRTLAENGIRCVWLRAGTQAQRRELGCLVRLGAARRFEEIVRRAGRLIEAAPSLAEAWRSAAAALRPRPLRRVHPRLPRGPGVEPLSLRRLDEHGPGVRRAGQPGLRLGVFSPRPAVESRLGGRAASGGAVVPAGRGQLKNPPIFAGPQPRRRRQSGRTARRSSEDWR